MKYLHLSAASGLSARHGGVRRSEQLEEMLKISNGISINPYIGFKQSIIFALKKPFTLLESFSFSCYLFFIKGLSLRGLMQYAFYSVRLMRALKENSYDIVIHETAASISIPFMHYMSWKKIRYVAVPHNIEFLVPTQIIKIFRSNHHVYRSEMEGFRAAELVLSLSDFDSAILRSGGVNAKTLEYRPTKSDKHLCDSIRNARKNKKSENYFLMLGTVSNVPTFNGMKELLDNMSLSVKDNCIILAGYGTEVFGSYNSSSIKVVGSVSDEELKELLIGAKALIINQPQTTGFLTKIVEMNLCGLPQIFLSEYIQVSGWRRFGIFRTEVNNLSEVAVTNAFDILPDIDDNNALINFINQ